MVEYTYITYTHARTDRQKKRTDRQTYRHAGRQRDNMYLFYLVYLVAELASSAQGAGTVLFEAFHHVPSA